jgi:hypothetical protein
MMKIVLCLSLALAANASVSADRTLAAPVDKTKTLASKEEGAPVDRTKTPAAKEESAPVDATKTLATLVTKEEFAPMDVTKFKDELASAMVVKLPSKCNARECAHWNCDTWCWCFEHYGHLLQPWLDTYAANAGCLPDGTECACKPPGGITIEDPPLDVDIYEVPPEWVDPLWDPSPLDDIRQQFIAEKFPYIRKYDAPVEDGPGTWGEPTEQEIKAMLQIIDLYLPINNKELTADARIKLMDEFKREMEGNLLKLAGAQMRRPQMQQFRTMATAIGELRASPDAHDHATAREMELHLDTNLQSLAKALTTQFQF